MKKILLIITLFTSIISFGQDKFTTYESSYIDKSYNIDISIKDYPKFTLYINAYSLDKLHDKGGFMVTNKRHQAFLDALSQAKNKYQEWTNVAKENSVTELDKPMKIDLRTEAYFMYGNKWQFDYGVFPSFYFKVAEDERGLQYILIVRSGELKSSSNEYMSVDGVAFAFSSVEEIDDFISKISQEKIDEFVNKPKADDLFKD
jgi:hypothetical protein